MVRWASSHVFRPMILWVCRLGVGETVPDSGFDSEPKYGLRISLRKSLGLQSPVDFDINLH